MKKLLICSLAALTLTGCMLPNYSRLIPENKSAHIMVFSPLYGWVVIDTRAIGDTNALPPLPNPPPTPEITIQK